MITRKRSNRKKRFTMKKLMKSQLILIKKTLMIF